MRYFLLTLLALCVLPQTLHAQAIIQTPAKQVILLDYDTGMVLFEKNAETRMPTSSMSKVMTMYMVFEALQHQQISLDDKLLVSEKAWRKGGSKMFVEVDKRVRVEDLVQGVIVQSGNDSAIVLAEGLAGTEDAFAEALNAKAKELGMDSSQFRNASGWPNPEHYSTARDLSTLARALIKNFPEYYHYYGQKEYTYNKIRQQNRNPLLYRNMGADGIKTGHTEAGGYGLMASGVHNGRRAILVINGLKDEKARAQESAKLLEFGMVAFQNHTLFKAGDIVESVGVVMGKDDVVSAMTDEDVFVTVPTVARRDVKVEAVFQEPLQAPIKKGQEIGVLRVNIPRLKALEYPLYASEGVKELGLISKTLVKAKLFFGGEK